MRTSRWPAGTWSWLWPPWWWRTNGGAASKMTVESIYESLVASPMTGFLSGGVCRKAKSGKCSLLFRFCHGELHVNSICCLLSLRFFFIFWLMDEISPSPSLASNHIKRSASLTWHLHLFILSHDYNKTTVPILFSLKCKVPLLIQWGLCSECNSWGTMVPITAVRRVLSLHQNCCWSPNSSEHSQSKFTITLNICVENTSRL